MVKKLVIIFGILAIISSGIYAVLSYSKTNQSFSQNYEFSRFSKIKNETNLEDNFIESQINQEIEKDLHIPKPEHVRGIYMSSWVAGTKNFRNNLTNLVMDTELNAIVIDFKDSEGVVSTPAGIGASMDRINAGSKRAPDLQNYIAELHSKGIYTVARIAVFEDPIYSKNNFAEAVQTSQGSLWKDRHGLSWVDPSSLDFHQYILELCLEAYDLGFDEINLDYIRFPTDGSKDKVFPISDYSQKQKIITDFVSYIYKELNSRSIPMSIDVFGQIVSTADDMGIGQYYEDLLVNTDIISPMVYPSHFYPGYKNLSRPESMPYETIKYSIQDAIRRREAIGSTTEIRAWVQDFSLAIPYGLYEVKEQIRALEELGIQSYFVWDPKNKYTKEAYLKNLIN